MTDPSTSATPGAGGRVAEHYRTLLAANYTWMLGGDIEATTRPEGPPPGPAPVGRRGSARGGGRSGLWVGGQTLALADLGYDSVIAVDTDPILLAELATHTGDRPAVRTVEGDAVDGAADLEPGSVAVAVCIGDTPALR